MSKATLFIPDISGFTKFVKSTEIKHSKHIIEELINIIITTGKKGFEFAEVEGDAVFLYREKGCAPEELIQHAKKIFVAFHKHLVDYEHNRICECGACTTAVDLRLKFITHAGEIGFANYGVGKAKPYGDAVIAVHRLLKNNVPLDQYVLLTDDFLSESQLKLDGESEMVDEALGRIPFKYLRIDHWRSDVVIDKKELKKAKVDLEVTSSEEIELSAHDLHQFISMFKYRHLWNKGAEKIIYNEDEINQSGSEHFCVVNGKDLQFDTIKPDFEEGLAYGEVLKNPGPFKYLESNFLISDVSSGRSRLKVIIRVGLKWKLQKILLPILRNKMQQQAKQFIQSIEDALPEFSSADLLT